MLSKVTIFKVQETCNIYIYTDWFSVVDYPRRTLTFVIHVNVNKFSSDLRSSQYALLYYFGLLNKFYNFIASIFRLSIYIIYILNTFELSKANS